MRSGSRGNWRPRNSLEPSLWSVRFRWKADCHKGGVGGKVAAKKVEVLPLPLRGGVNRESRIAPIFCMLGSFNSQMISTKVNIINQFRNFVLFNWSTYAKILTIIIFAYMRCIYANFYWQTNIFEAIICIIAQLSEGKYILLDYLSVRKFYDRFVDFLKMAEINSPF